MSSPQETAEAILIVLKRILKWLLIASISIGVLIWAFFGYTDHQRSQDYEKKKKQEEKVTIYAYYPGEGCAVGYPYFYVIKNNSDKEVSKVEFWVEVRKKGFSKPLNSYTSIEEYKILKPEDKWARCFRAENKDWDGDVTEKDVEIVVTWKNVTFSK